MAVSLLALAVSWPTYVHLKNWQTLQALDDVTEATSADGALPSSLASTHAEDRHATHLKALYPEAVAARLLRFPSLQLESAFAQLWTLPLLALLLMGQARNRAPNILSAFWATLAIAGTAYVAVNTLLALVAVCLLQAVASDAGRAAVCIPFVMTALMGMYLACFVLTHQVCGRSTARWWLASLLTMGLSWSARTAMPFLGLASIVPFLPGGVERFLFDPGWPQVGLGLTVCVGWTVLFLAASGRNSWVTAGAVTVRDFFNLRVRSGSELQ